MGILDLRLTRHQPVGTTADTRAPSAAQTAPAVEPSVLAGLTHHVCDDFERLRPLRDAWNHLAEQAGDLMSSYDWCEVWWRHFGNGRPLEIHTLHADGQLVGVLPLFRERLAGAAGLRVVHMVGCYYTIDVAGLAVQPAYAPAFLQTVLDNLDSAGPWDLLQLGPLRSYAAHSESMAQTAARHVNVQTVIHGACDSWQTIFDLPPTYEQYFAALAGDERRDTARRERQLHDGRTVQIEPVCRPEDVPAAMDTLISLHQRLWTGRGWLGQFGESAAVERFHREMAERMVQTGQLAMATVTVDGERVGTAYGYHFGARTHTMFRGYRNDNPWRRYALGRLLHCHMVQQAIERGSNQLEDGRGVFEYKLRLGGRLHGERSLMILRRGWRTRLRFWAALRTAYLLHGLYARLWADILAPRLKLRRPVHHWYVASCFLAHLFKRTHLRFWQRDVLHEADHVAAPDGHTDER